MQNHLNNAVALQASQIDVIIKKYNQAMDLFDHSCDIKHLPKSRYELIMQEPAEIITNHLQIMEASLIAKHLREVFINN